MSGANAVAWAVDMGNLPTAVFTGPDAEATAKSYAAHTDSRTARPLIYGDTAPPSAPVGAAEDMVLDAIERRESSAPVDRPHPSDCTHRFMSDPRKCLRCGWDFREGDPPEPLSAIVTQPTEGALSNASAPVGVESAARRVASYLDHANLDTSRLPAGMGSALRALRTALAQQPAACPKCGGTGEADSGGIMPWGAPAMIPCDCKQPAAVDGMDAKLALANDISRMFGNTNKAMTDHLWSLGYRKVAAQPGGGA